MTRSPTIEARGVTYAYDRRTAVNRLEMSVAAGEFVCLVGPNGSGKTTALRLLAGELVPAEGEALIDGATLWRLTVRERASHRAFLAQHDRRDVPYPVRTVVGFGAYASAMDTHEREARVTRALSALEIDSLADRPVAELSGGERRRVAIARTLVQDGTVLLMDEPTDSLDLGHADVVMRRCRSEARDGRAVVVSTHDLNLAARHADTVVMLRHGEVRSVGTASDVLTAEALSEVYECDVRVMQHPVDGRPVVFL